MVRGKFIVIESNDRAGKSTLADNLKRLIPNTIIVKFPDRGGLHGDIINDFLSKKIEMDEEEITKLFIENRLAYKQTMIDYLENGVNIICDRYSYSGCVYSYYKKNKEQLSFTSDTINKLNDTLNKEIGMPKEDLIILVDGYFKTVLNELYDGEEHREKIFQLFKFMFECNKYNYEVFDNTHSMYSSLYNINLEELVNRINNMKVSKIKYI